MNLGELFTETNYAFQFRFQRGTFATFFSPSADHNSLMTQRRHWLSTAPETYLALLPEGAPLLEETIALAREHGTIESSSALLEKDPVDPLERCQALGSMWEPDFLLLHSDSSGRMRLLGGCVCFPSHWSLAEKMGRPIEEIHGVVPGLNQALGKQIDAFMAKLRAPTAWLRVNWGLSRSAEFNLHPERGLSGLDQTIKPEEIWLRVEHQALLALPASGGVLFGIRLALHSLSQIASDQQVRQGLCRALETMPEPVAQYKGLAAIRAPLIAWLKAFQLAPT